MGREVLGSVMEGFDASKTGKIPNGSLARPPRDEPTVTLGFISETVGFGLFAARDIAQGEWFMHEAPALVAPFNAIDAGKTAEIEKELEAYRDAIAKYGQVLVHAYPKVALGVGMLVTGIDMTGHGNGNFFDFDGLERNLVPGEGKWAGSTVTAEEYKGYLDRVRVQTTNPGRNHRGKCLAVRTFFKNYAFLANQNPISDRAGGSTAHKIVSTTKEGCIYLLGSMINHRCYSPEAGGRENRITGPNAEFSVGKSGGLSRFVRPKHIAVRARRQIPAGEEITVDYGKSTNDFVCMCETCQSRKISCTVM